MNRTVLLASELGAGGGHFHKLLQLAQALASRSYQPVLAVRDPLEVYPWSRRLRFPVLQAPQLNVRTDPSQVRVNNSVAGVMAAFGLEDPQVVGSVLQACHGLLTVVDPGLLIADYSPLLSLAAHGVCPVLVIGSGFCLPPPELPTCPNHDERQSGSDQAVLEAIRAAQGEAEKWSPPSLPALFGGARHFVLCFREMDPHAGIRQVPAVGPLDPARPARAGEPSWDLFVYLAAEDSRSWRALEAVALSGLSARVFLRNRDRLLQPPPRAEAIRYLDAPVPMDEALATSRAIVHHGGLGTTQQALLAGRSQFLVPRHLEQLLNARMLAALGVGHRLRARHSIAEAAAILRDELLAPASSQLAGELGADFRERYRDGSLPRVLDACEALLVADRRSVSVPV